MHINRDLLFVWLQQFIWEKYEAAYKELVPELCSKIIFNDPAKNCIIKGSKEDWNGLLDNKSLFHSPPGCGLPISNLSSQVFANFYMNRFDHFIKEELGIRYYGRYVDDFLIVHPDNEYLKSLVHELAKYLQESLGLTLHPKKIFAALLKRSSVFRNDYKTQQDIYCQAYQREFLCCYSKTE